MRFFRRSRLALAGLVLCGGLSALDLVGSGSTAYASEPLAGISADSSGFYLDTLGGGLFQDQGQALASQEWYVPSAGSQGRIKNDDYKGCLTTDGAAGDEVYLWPCSRGLAAYQTWTVLLNAPGYEFLNPHFGLVLDVYGGSDTPGAPIDAWPYNGGSNQWFQLQFITQ